MLAHRIKEFRKARGWSQERLGDAIGLDGTAISKIEKGTRRVAAQELTQIARALEMPVAELIETPDVLPVTGLSEELIPYEARPVDPFTALQTDNRYLLTVACDSLSRVGIFRGDVILVDGSATACAKVKALDPVRAQYHPDSDQFTKGVTLLRQFVPPGLLITNSGTQNAPPLDMTHDDVQILAVVVSIHRALQT